MYFSKPLIVATGFFAFASAGKFSQGYRMRTSTDSFKSDSLTVKPVPAPGRSGDTNFYLNAALDDGQGLSIFKLEQSDNAEDHVSLVYRLRDSDNYVRSVTVEGGSLYPVVLKATTEEDPTADGNWRLGEFIEAQRFRGWGSLVVEHGEPREMDNFALCAKEGFGENILHVVKKGAEIPATCRLVQVRFDITSGDKK